MSKSNKTSSSALNVDELNLLIDGANASLRATKDSAKKAAAYVYMVWLRTSSGEAKKWLEQQIEKRNVDIDKYNDELKRVIERADNFMAGKITSLSDIVNRKPKDAEEQKAQSEEIAVLKKYAAMSDKERALERLVRVEAREGTSPFNAIIKFVFKIMNKNELDIVNRYAHTLDWIKAHFADKEPADADEVCAAIEGFGGFEAVVHHQRLLPTELTETEADRQAIKAFILAQQKQGLKTAASIGDVPLQSEKSLGAPILLLGRYLGGRVEVIGEANMTEADLDRAVNNYGGIGALPIEPETEFVGRVLELGQVVEEGQEGLETYDGTQAGVKVKSQRVLSLLAGAERPRFVLSARDAETGIVIHGEPNNAPKLISANQNLVLTNKQLRMVSEMLSNEARRRLISISAIADPKTGAGKLSECPMAWKAVNVALVSANRQSEDEGQQITWSSMANVRERALDVDGFRPNAGFAMPKSEVEAVMTSLLKPWSESKDARKNQRLMRWSLTSDGVTFSMPDKAEHKSSVPVRLASSLTASFRVKDMLAVFKKLKDQKADSYQIDLDDGGLVAISWKDDVGSYAVHVPSVGKDGYLQARRVAPMRASDSFAIAAE